MLIANLQVKHLSRKNQFIQQTRLNFMDFIKKEHPLRKNNFMKLLLALIFCTSFSAMAGELYVTINVIDITNGNPIKDASISLGNDLNFHSYDNGDYIAPSNQKLERYNLTDTLFIHYPDFSFELKPLIEHDYYINTVHGEVEYIGLTLYGVPHIRNYSLELPIAKSHKTNIDTVLLNIFTEEDEDVSAIRLMNLDGDEILTIQQNWKGKNHLVQYVNYHALEDGYFEIEAKGILKRYPFKKLDFSRPIYLRSPAGNRSQELELLQAHLELKKDQIRAQKKRERLHNLEINRYRSTIDSLETVIYILKNGPIEGIAPSLGPERYLEQSVVDYYFAEPQLTEPVMGKDVFLNGLKHVLSECVVKKSGIAEIKVVVSKSGKATYYTTHENPQIVDIINDYLYNIDWTVEEHNDIAQVGQVNFYIHFYKK